MALLTRVTIILPPTHSEEEADRLLALLALQVAHGWEEDSPPTGEFVCTVYCTVPESAEALKGLVSGYVTGAKIDISLEEEADWVEAWKEFFTPVQGGEHFLVLAPWMERERAQTTRIPIIIEPKTAFGTGHHETTALCLDAISLLFAQKSITEDMRFLDLGTGSGILGLACAKLGLCGEGLDIDLAAVENAVENRTGNAIPPERFSVALGGVEEAGGPYDLILANILAAPLREMAPAIAALPGTERLRGKRPLLVLSGLLAVQADAVEAAYLAQGYAKPARLCKGEWVALIFA